MPRLIVEEAIFFRCPLGDFVMGPRDETIAEALCKNEPNAPPTREEIARRCADAQRTAGNVEAAGKIEEGL